MNAAVKLGGGVVAASAICCAVSFMPALLAGTALGALGGATLSGGAWLLVLAAPVAAGVWYVSRRQPGNPSSGCGCASTSQKDAVIACSLGATDFKARTAEIRDLARRSLRQASRQPLSLILTYEPEARDEVRALIARERECCPFLTFSVREEPDAIEVAIVAPASAAAAADALFDHFARELAASNTREIA